MSQRKPILKPVGSQLNSDDLPNRSEIYVEIVTWDRGITKEMRIISSEGARVLYVTVEDLEFITDWASKP